MFNIQFQTPLGGIHLHETRKKFLEGSLHPANVLMCPHTCVTNLPKPREHRPDRDVTPSAVHVGNIVQGARMAWAQGRELNMTDEEGDGSKKVDISYFFHLRIFFKYFSQKLKKYSLLNMPAL